MLCKADLASLGLPEKRQIARALLARIFAEPRALPLSHAQEQLWFMDKLQPGSPLYNIPVYVPFEGTFDLHSLKRALAALSRRHDMLRARFETQDGQPVQIVAPDVSIEIALDDLSSWPAARRDEALAAGLNAEAQTGFNLSQGPCIRYRLFRLARDTSLLSATMHHIIADAVSLGIFVSELNQLYAGFRQHGRELQLPPLAIEYSDYARWQREMLRGFRLSKLLDYWTTALAGAPQVLKVETDYPRPDSQSFSGTVASFVFPDELSKAVIGLAREHKLTPFMVLLACYCALLYRHTGQDDMLIGAPVANRDHPELERVIGLFVNTLILRARFRDDTRFADLLEQVHATALAAFRHQALPFPMLVAALNVERTPGHAPLYQVVFNFQNASLIEAGRPRSDSEVLAEGGFPFAHSNTSKVDLNLTVTQNGDSISGGFEYADDLFSPPTIAQMIAHFTAITAAVVADPSVEIMDITLDAAAEGPGEEIVDEGRFSFELDL
jgi:NRPS condensation-like uncharacterized protein